MINISKRMSWVRRLNTGVASRSDWTDKSMSTVVDEKKKQTGITFISSIFT